MTVSPTHITTSFTNNDDSPQKLCNGSQVLLEDVFEIDGRSVNVYFTETQLCWFGPTNTFFCAGGKSTHSISFCNIFLTRYEQKKGRHNEIEMFPSQYFSIHYAKKQKHHKLKSDSITFHTIDSSTCKIWVDCIHNKMKEHARPKNLLIFINPVGGKKMAQQIFREKVAPIFDLAKITQHIIVTTHQEHAKEMLYSEDLSKYDGVISVGGDGMFSEVLNGVLREKDGAHAVETAVDGRPLRIGLIPAGSTDTVVYCTTGASDPTTCALHIVVGSELALDVCSVSGSEGFIKYSLSLMGYGYFGDVIRESEKMRWLGPKRYDVAGFKRFMINKSYEGEVSFLQSANPSQNTRCTSGCGKCSSKDDEVQESEWTTVGGRFISVIGANISCRCARSSTGISPHAHLGDGFMDLILIRKTTRAKYLHHLFKVQDNDADNFNFNFIDVFRVKELKFRSLPSQDNQNNDVIMTSPHTSSGERSGNESSVWNIDGEIVEESDIHIRVHRQLITVYAAGIDE